FVRLSDKADAATALRKSEYKFEGYASYNPATGRFLHFDLVGLGDHHDTRPITKSARFEHYYDPTGHVYLSVRVEQATPDSVGYGTPPLAIRSGERAALVTYFGPDLDPSLLSFFRLKR